MIALAEKRTTRVPVADIPVIDCGCCDVEPALTDLVRQRITTAGFNAFPLTVHYARGTQQAGQVENDVEIDGVQVSWCANPVQSDAQRDGSVISEYIVE